MYSKINIHGHCDLNYVWSKVSVSEDDIVALKESGVHSPTWDSDTYFLVDFNSNLNGGDETLRGIDGYYIYSQEIGKTVRRFIDKVDETCTHIKDYSVKNRSSYRYFIIPSRVDSDTPCEEIETETVEMNTVVASIVGLTPTGKSNTYTVDSTDVWNFSLNGEMEDFKPQYNKNIINTIGRFPKVYGDKTAYLTGGGSFLLGSATCEVIDYINDDIEKINKWVDFCNNGKPKLFRDMKGHVILCDITETSYNYEGKLQLMPTTVSFTFTQIGDASNISVYGKDF